MIPDETLQVLRTIYRGQTEGYLTLTAIHPSGDKPTPSRHLYIRDKNGIHRALEDLLRANGQGWGAYFSVALRKAPLGRWKRGGLNDLLNISALYADLDSDLATSFDLLSYAHRDGLPGATAMIGSGRGLHLMWSILPTDDFLQVNRVLAGLADMLQGDQLTAATAIRLPGSHNTKPHVNRACKLMWIAPERRYVLDDFLPFARVEKPPSPPSSIRWNRAPPIRSNRLNPKLIEAVVVRLMSEYGGFVQKRNGWIGSLCPAGHQRDHPGSHFAFNPQTGFGICLGKHNVFNLKMMCQLLNLNPADYGGIFC